MAVDKAQLVALFPTSGVVDEELLIGRLTEIESLTESALAGENRIIAEPRRVGKSSLIGAALKRILRHPEQKRTALSVDLRDGISNSPELAVELLNQARQQRAGGRRAVIKQLARHAEEAAQAAVPLDLDKIAADLDAEEVSAAVQGLAAALGQRRASLREVFKILDEFGRAKTRPTIVFIDEVQEIGRWLDGEIVLSAIAAAAKRAGSTISFVLTGSRVSTVKALFEEPGAPLMGVVRPLPLPRIDDEIWQEGLTARYRSCGMSITRDQIRTVLAVSDGHPLKTMLICRETLDWLVADDSQVSDLAVEQAVVTARANPVWGQL
jgi:hypothetical protein